MRVSVVIPNWNGVHFLSPLFADLLAQSLPPAEVIVVDNGSDDRSVEWARGAGAEVLELGRNRGFAAAVNEGVRASRSAWVAVLNNDVRLDRCWLELLAAGIGATAFAVGKVLSAQSPDVIDGTWDAVCCGGTAWRCGAGRPDSAVWSRPQRIQFPPFTAILVRRDVFLETGGLDEAFGSYLEDVEFGLRCASKGHIGIYVPQARVWHVGSGTLGVWSARTVRHIAKNQVLLVARHYPPELLRRFGWRIAVAQLLWGILALRHGRILAWFAGKLEGLRLFGRMRQPGFAGIGDVIESSEEEIRRLQRETGFDAYWRLYFGLT